MAEVARVTALIGCSLISQPLEKIARSLGASPESLKVRESDLLGGSEVKATSKSEPKNTSKPNQKPDTEDVVMYRGVRIRR
jgi:hypothetical protein